MDGPGIELWLTRHGSRIEQFVKIESHCRHGIGIASLERHRKLPAK